VELERTALMRYAEQFLQELPLELPAGALDPATASDLAERFDAEYARLYGAGARAVFQAVELFAIRVIARVPLGFATYVSGNDEQRDALVSERRRDVFWPTEREWLSTALHTGVTLAEGTFVDGPAVIELPHTAVSVPTGQRLRRDRLGNLALTVA
jgi:N-methylhydantoinase A